MLQNAVSIIGTRVLIQLPNDYVVHASGRYKLVIGAKRERIDASKTKTDIKVNINFKGQL